MIRREWHTDIGLPVEEIASPLAILEKPFPGVRFLAFGFGERQFLVNHEKGLGAMLGALLPSQSALLMTALAASPNSLLPAGVVALRVSVPALSDPGGLVANLTFSRRRPILLANGPYEGSVYYAARTLLWALHLQHLTADILSRRPPIPQPLT